MTTSPFPNSEIKTHGLSPVPRSFHALLSPAENPDYNPSLTPGPYSPLSSSNAPPSTSLATVVNQYARQHLSEPTYNHSFRVYHYGRAIQTQHFHSQGSWSFSPETYFLACLLHDIGTTSENLRRTALSFEFWGGVEALRVLEGAGAGLVQRESVAEAVVRHQDLGEEGKIGAVGALLQIATVLDNLGKNAELVSEETIQNVVAAYPRLGWSKCFAATIREENGLKPWCHTTVLGEEQFPNGVLGNKIMTKYE